MSHLNWGCATSVPTSPFALAWSPALPTRSKSVRPRLLGHPCRQRRAESIQSVGPRALSAGKRSALSYLLGRACRWSPGCAADQSLRTDPCLWAHAVKVLCALNGFVRPRNRPRFGECALNGFERSDLFKAHGGKRGRMCRHTNPAKPHMWPRPTADGGLADSLGAPNPRPNPKLKPKLKLKPRS